MKKKILFIIIIFSLFSLLGCQRRTPYIYEEGKVNVVVTTTMIADLVKEVGKDKVAVTTIMSYGVDPHSFVPRPSVTTAINKADLVITNGLNLEAKMGKVLEMLNNNKSLALGDSLEQSILLKDENGAIDPHVWFDVNIWKSFIEVVKDKLISIDIENKEFYQLNSTEYATKLENLNEYILSKVEELPEEKRILITAHDAFSYFGSTYGFEVYSIQGISTESQASVKDIQNLANLIVKLQVKAIFLESSIPEETIKSVINATKAQKHNLIIGGTLYSDSLGDPTTEANTYIKMVKHNVDAIIESLK